MRVCMAAVPLPPGLTAPLLRREMGIVTTFVHGTRHGQLRVHPRIRRASRHVAALVAESVAIGVAAAIVDQAGYGWQRVGPHHVDAIVRDQPQLSGAFDPDTGAWRQLIRPDLIFPVPHGQIFVEAKGRTLPQQLPQSAPNSSQRRSLRRLNSWAHHRPGANGAPAQWCSAWTWLTETFAQIDFFDPGEPTEIVAPDDLDRAMRERADALFASSDPRGVEIADGVVLRGEWLDVPEVGIGPRDATEVDTLADLQPDGDRRVFLGVLRDQLGVDRLDFTDEVLGTGVSSAHRYVVGVQHQLDARGRPAPSLRELAGQLAERLR